MKTRLLLIAAILATALMPVSASAEPALTVGVAYDIGGRISCGLRKGAETI